MVPPPKPTTAAWKVLKFGRSARFCSRTAIDLEGNATIPYFLSITAILCGSQANYSHEAATRINKTAGNKILRYINRLHCVNTSHLAN